MILFGWCTMATELEALVRLLLAILLGGIIGYEREIVHKPAGVRTHMLVALGSTLFTLASLYGFPGSDPARIASYIVAGVGFIGGGVIIQSRDRVIGITTAASLWTTAAVGVTVGTGLYLLSILGVVLCVIILRLVKKVGG